MKRINKNGYFITSGIINDRVKMVTDKKDIRLNRERMVGMLVKKDIMDIKGDVR